MRFFMMAENLNECLESGVYRLGDFFQFNLYSVLINCIYLKQKITYHDSNGKIKLEHNVSYIVLIAINIVCFRKEHVSCPKKYIASD